MKKVLLFSIFASILLASCDTKGNGSCGFAACTISITLSPNSAISLEQGKSTTVSATVTANNGFSGTTELSANDLPAGVTATFNPKQVTVGGANSSTMTLAATGAAIPGGPTQLTISASGNGVAQSAKLALTLTPAPGPTSKTISGKILRLDGKGLSGVQVQIQDPGGTKPLVSTSSDGSFQVTKVFTPYSISAYVPGSSNTPYRPTTWSGVTRSDPQVVFPSNNVSWITSCTRADATVSGNISPAIPAGSTGYVIFIGRGVSRYGYTFDDPGYSYMLGTNNSATTYNLAVSFDRGLCATQITGSLVYFEKDAGGAFTRAKLIKPVNITTGNTTTQDITSFPYAPLSLNVKLNAPAGTPNASFYPTVRVDGITVHCCGSDFGNALADKVNVPAGGTTTFDLPSLSGLEYRIHMHGSPYPTQTSAYWSETAVATGNLELNLLNLIGPIGPTGALSGSSPFTPNFTFNQVSGATLYRVTIEDTATSTLIWTGHTSTPVIQLPFLGAPATLTPGTYKWTVAALALRENPTIDDLLDGRMVKRNWDFDESHYYPDEIIGVSYNQNGTSFNVP